MSQRQLRITGSTCRCATCGGIKKNSTAPAPKAAAITPAPPQTSWTLDQARVALQKLNTQDSSAARRASELIVMAFPSLAEEAAAPAMPTVAAQLQARPSRSHITFPNQPTVASAAVSRPGVAAPPMPSMSQRIAAHRATK